jgi:hypothetical protein
MQLLKDLWSIIRVLPIVWRYHKGQRKSKQKHTQLEKENT